MQLDEWRKLQAEGEEATLPSGLEIRVKRVGVMDLAAQGKIPQALQPLVEKLMSQQNGQVKVVKLAEFQEFAAVIDLICTVVIVSPAALAVTELGYMDRLALFTWANEVGQKLKPFR